MANFGERIVVLIDMDCFFCQVEARLQPQFQGKPLAVVQYNQWKLGGIIAVNYEARDFGVTRHMRGEEAKEKCPEIILASVPALRGKSDTSRYRSAGREVIDVLKKHCNKIERASVDEAYLDITQMVENRLTANPESSAELLKQLSNTFVVGYSESDENDEEQRSKGLQNWLTASIDELNDLEAQKFAIAGAIVEEIRADVYETTKFRCSAGISYNKILAKLACGLHKPNRQTILPSSGVPSLFKTLPVKKVRNLGGKLGDVVIDSLKCNVMSDLLRYSLMDLQKLFDEKTGFWLYNIARGIDNEPVTTRLVSKSIGVCKKFPGKQAITNADLLKNWLKDLTAEVCERLEQDLEDNERRATLLTVSYHYYQDRVEISQSRSCPLNSYKPEKVAASCFNVITKSVQHPIAFIGLSAGKFVAAKGSDYFRSFFKTIPNKEDSEINSTESLETKNTSVEFENNHEVDSVSNAIENNCTTDFTMEKSDSTTDENNSKQEEIVSKTTEKEKLLISYKKTSRDSVDRALNSEHLKQSFFMNILKKSHESAGDEATNFHAQVNEEKQNKTFDRSRLNLIDSEENHLDSEKIETISFQDDEISSTSLAISSKAENPKNHEEMEAEPKSSLYSQASNSNWSAAKMDNVEPFVNNNGKVSVKLHEIFPDLCDIDPGVISLLPPELQKEASELLKNTTKTNKKIELIAKHNKTKKSKQKLHDQSSSSKSENSIQNFLIKSSASEIDDTVKKCDRCNQLVPIEKLTEHNDYHMKKNNNKPMCQPGSSKSENSIQNFLIKSSASEIDDSVKKCDKCSQLVPVEKLIEHNDFHMAHELQREMNKTSSTITQDNNCMKRKKNFDSNLKHSKKRDTKNLKNSTRSKSITSYFS